MTRATRHLGWRYLVVISFATGILSGVPGSCADPTDTPAAPAPAGNYDLKPQPLPRVRPGTVVGNSAPDGWTDLIIKSLPRIAQGDVSKAPGLTVSMARLLSVSIVAATRPVEVDGRTRYRLERVAIGLGTRIRDVDTIISSDTQAQLGANFGMIARTVLSTSETEVESITQVLRSPTMLMFDVPTIVVYQGAHRPMIIRHSVLVDPGTGRLFTLVWLVNKDDTGRYTTSVGTMNLLAPNTIEDRELSVDPDQFTFGIPSATAVAMVHIPLGTPIDIPEALRLPAAAQSFTEQSAQAIETELRGLIRESFRQQLSAQKQSHPASPRPTGPLIK